MSALALPVALIRHVPRRLEARLRGAELAAHRWLVAHAVACLRVSLGAIFLGFGVLKFFPGVSPAQGLVERTADIVMLGILPGSVALVLVAEHGWDPSKGVKLANGDPIVTIRDFFRFADLAA